jgi:hypothetical protein
MEHQQFISFLRERNELLKEQKYWIWGSILLTEDCKELLVYLKDNRKPESGGLIK